MGVFGGGGPIVSYSATASSKIIRMSATEMANSTTTTDAEKGNCRGQKHKTQKKNNKNDNKTNRIESNTEKCCQSERRQKSAALHVQMEKQRLPFPPDATPQTQHLLRRKGGGAGKNLSKIGVRVSSVVKVGRKSKEFLSS